MKQSVRIAVDLFREVMVYENGLNDFALPELTGVKLLCKTVIGLADEKQREIESRNAEMDAMEGER